MKTKQKTRSSKGFTLIELLVVITIIAVLAGLSFAGVNLAIKKAKKLQGETLANNLASAVDNFYGEYNRLPEVNGDEIETDSGPGVQLLQVLLALEPQGNNTQNSRSITFLQAPEAKGKKGGIVYSGADNADGLYDPFGNPFTVVLNSNFEDTLEFQFDGRPVRLRGKQVAVYSPGGDREEGTPDDITSWNN
ncbi:MAG: prepilin-type N-terminal cleavage/methylation domain-containing protein [Verrucomicrobiota bacterium]